MQKGSGEVAKEKIKTVYVCTACKDVSSRWMGRCPSCGEWNTLEEETVKQQAGKGLAPTQSKSHQINSVAVSKRLSDIDAQEDHSRIITGIGELDRVLGGGIVLGSVVLIGGEPGAGKSTLLLQLCGALDGDVQILYVTGEESARQIKLRAMRLNVNGETTQLAAQTDIDSICALMETAKPGLVIIDSIQTMNSAEMSSSAGSISQVKECTARLQSVAKSLEIPIFIVGHVNKDGAIAGPKVMEHIVDTVLYFEGDKTLPYRILRAVKNRYGSTNEIGMFDMTQTGLQQIENPSSLLLNGRQLGVSGSCVACAMEGTRPVLSEVQALVTKSGFGTPRRAAIGFDYNRMNLLLAVLEKRAGYFMGNLDVYINIVGGLELDETACDLPVCMAIVSALTDKPMPGDMIAFGEVGLGGELRLVANIEQRVKEAQRMGFTRALLPKQSMERLNVKDFKGMELLGVDNICTAIALV